MKERRNLRKEQPKRKLNEKETWSYQLNRQQNQCSTNNIESAPSDNTPVQTIDAIRSNASDKDLDKSVLKNSSTADQQTDRFLIGKPFSLGVGENKTKTIKTMTKIFLIKWKELCIKQKENTKCRRNLTAPTKNKNNHVKENKYIQPTRFNLSSTTLYMCQTSILLRGLKFSSRTKSNSIQLTFDL